jgi:hypothetical protein
MVRRQIELDDETDRQLEELAQEYEGNLGQALAGLLRTRESVESLLDEHEERHRDVLLTQRDRSEGGFQPGRATPWAEIKRRNSL